MSTRFLCLASAAVAAVLCIPGAASALSFSGDWTITTIRSTDPGLVVETSASSGSFSTPDLAVGASHTFSLFDIWTDEADAAWFEDTVPYPISVSFNFSSPAAAAVVGGTTQGHNFLLFQWGELDWEPSTTVSFGPNDSGTLTLALSDVIFNKGLFGLKEGERHGANVTATLKYTTAPVPLPATLPLLLGGIALVGAVRRRATVRAA